MVAVTAVATAAAAAEAVVEAAAEAVVVVVVVVVVRWWWVVVESGVMRGEGVGGFGCSGSNRAAAYLESSDAERVEKLRTGRGGPRRVGVRGGHWPPRVLSASASAGGWWWEEGKSAR